ncbi:MAG: S58 family peptidase [Gemmatimonadales bacterium]|nr:S58 family peptidase [Gemmatimonadales bacterium]NIN13089.1 S58 family peptidase [Gemmatimonadales bacterium]NIN51173.1 S58 family peptidase [Gemmatimonadales bacterium]NIP08637.1 S58 family peptidase [Gemmatimonadales bacterium]NIR02325.1 S58 family peptidase [Gemmatimonadales bacterium]
MRAGLVLCLVAALVLVRAPLEAQERATARELGVVVGILSPGPLNAITDVAGVRVGQVTIARGDSINTGVTAILPHSENVFREKVPAAVVVGNGFGKLVGFTQVQELGELESPVVLTCTLCVPRAADAVLTYLLSLPGNEGVRSANAVVGETNDGYLSHIRLRPITQDDVLGAIRSAKEGPVEQGSVGAGRGTTAFGWKGGIGSSSRRLPSDLGGWTVGVLVQSNYGGVLTIAGAPVGQELGRHYLRGRVPGAGGAAAGSGWQVEGDPDLADGSIMIVVATDAPLSHRNLERLARRALAGLARTGSSMTNGSGDYVIAFTTVPVSQIGSVPIVSNNRMSPLFQAVIEATEEAIYNSLFMATTVKGHRGTVEALPVEATLEILKRHGVVR